MFDWQFFFGGVVALYYFWIAAREDLASGLISGSELKHFLIFGVVGWLVWVQGISVGLVEVRFLFEPLRSLLISVLVIVPFLFWFKQLLGKGDIYLLLIGQVAMPVFVFGVPFSIASWLFGMGLAAYDEKGKFKAVPFIFAGSLAAFLLWAAGF